jgi:gluconolactonase
MKNRLVLLFCAAALTYGQDYTLGPDSQPQADVPKGAIAKHTLLPGRFYPGTSHSYSVYVPAQYNAGKPTPFMIFLDGSGRLGNGERVPTVFDNLIAKGDLPTMIGISSIRAYCPRFRIWHRTGSNASLNTIR